MKNKFLLIVFGVVSLLVLPKYSYADWGHHQWGNHGAHQWYHYHDHPHYGWRVAHFYPNEYYPLWVGGMQYYYDDGVYYNYQDGGYVVATPPVGGVVSVIPSDFQAVVINGVTYYTNNGTYYVRTSNGYQVVAPPQAAPAPAGVVTVNVPSYRGGYVAVVIKRSGNGFVGPQGEFYASFPQISRLQVLYGR